VEAGSQLGHYTILTLLGSGGMGEVWKARDGRLRREVAIKMLPPTLAGDAARLTRFEREAELLASLNHHHIATIHGIEEHGGTRFLILELVEGETLDDRLARGPLPASEAFRLSAQLAEGLEAAHARGVVHRDLKPANIKITPAGRIKILDFGIAKALAADGDADATQTIDPTGTGVVIGTPAYMSPEQARGERVGVQTDIWSFGAVLYEMLTGRSPFRRKTTAETLASVLDARPDYDALPPGTPEVARRLIRRCLERDLSRRMQHIGDVRILLEEAAVPGDPRDAAEPPRSRPAAWVAGGVAAGLLTGAVVLWLAAPRATDRTPASPAHVSLPFLERPSSRPFGHRYLALSSDGSTVAYSGTSRLWIRRLDQSDPISVDTGSTSNPFFSPDGEWIGVFVGTALLKVPARGGAPVTVTETSERPLGGVWRGDGNIVYATSEALFQVPADGGERSILARPDRSRNEGLYAWPQLLPGGKSMLLTVVHTDPKQPPHVVVFDLTTRQPTPLVAGSSASYLANGLLVYAADSRLNVVPFDPSARRLTGTPVARPEIALAIAADSGAANFAVSDTGTLMYSSPPRAALRTLEWLDRRGQSERLAVEPETYAYAMVSPDGSRVAVERTTRGNRDIWILDLKRLTQVQLTDGPTEDMLPLWSPDGSRVFFASNRGGTFDVYSQEVSGTAEAKLEFGGPEFQAPTAVTPDGARVVVVERFNDLSLLNLAPPARLEPLLGHAAFDERLGEISPDGRWIAYESNESGNQFEIVLRSFPDVQARRDVISVGGGRYPRWGPKGINELYYVRPDGAMMVVPITLAPSLQIGPATKLFDWRKPAAGVSGRLYDVAPDGRFLVSTPIETDANGPTPVSLVLNWAAGLRAAPQ
jgi:serine/threonine-protein kinase